MTEPFELPEAVRSAIAATARAEAAATARSEAAACLEERLTEQEQTETLPLAERLLHWAAELARTVALPERGVLVYTSGQRVYTSFLVNPDGSVTARIVHAPYGGCSTTTHTADGLVSQYGYRRELPELLRQIDSGQVWECIEQDLARRQQPPPPRRR